MMMKELMERFAGIFGRHQTMSTDEVEEYLGVLELKIDANRLALEEHVEQGHSEPSVQ